MTITDDELLGQVPLEAEEEVAEAVETPPEPDHPIQEPELTIEQALAKVAAERPDLLGAPAQKPEFPTFEESNHTEYEAYIADLVQHRTNEAIQDFMQSQNAIEAEIGRVPLEMQNTVRAELLRLGRVPAASVPDAVAYAAGRAVLSGGYKAEPQRVTPIKPLPSTPPSRNMPASQDQQAYNEFLSTWKLTPESYSYERFKQNAQ